jgi:hypothetical protein
VARPRLLNVDRSQGGRHRYGLVLVIAFALTVLTLLTPDGVFGRAVGLLGAGLVLIVAVVTSRAPPRTRHLAGTGLAAVVTTGAVLSAVGHPRPVLTLAVTAVFLVAAGGVILSGLFRLIVEQGVVVQTVFGALAVYLLLGLTLGFVIGVIATGLSGAYFAQGTDATQATRMYYSFTVMTTTGFGDYTAATRGGKALAVLEMLIGQLYLVTVISILVGNLRRRNT